MRRLTLCLALIVALAACGADLGTEPITSTSAPPTTVVVTTATTTTTTVPPTTTAPPQSTTTLPEFPPERRDGEHGGYTWAVVLAGSADFNDPVLEEAARAARDVGYHTGTTGGCDHGAAEALGDPNKTNTVSVYFVSEADAQKALLAFEARGISGVVALVQTYCMD